MLTENISSALNLTPIKQAVEDTENAALIQIVGSLITTFAMYVPEQIPFNIASGLTESNINNFVERRDLGAGLAILSAIPPLDLNGKTLFLVVDLSEVKLNENNLSSSYRSVMKALQEIAIQNKAMLLQVNATSMGINCNIG
ncbi:hypothetical protein GGR58DRAFT_499218 [Xylaria digitata]|nr:hypothetical protein GGR58DRAFT_499218 [Xylaria digitata]